MARWVVAILLALATRAHARTPHLASHVERRLGPPPSVALLLYKQKRPAVTLPVEAVAASVVEPVVRPFWRRGLARAFGGASKVARRAWMQVIPGLVIDGATKIFDMLPPVLKRPVQSVLSSVHALILHVAARVFGLDEDAVNTALRWAGRILLLQLEYRAEALGM